MHNWRWNLFWIWLSVFFGMIGFGFAYPVLPFFIKDVYGVVDPASRNFYVACFNLSSNLGFLIFSPIWGKMADIYGRRMMLVRANFCCAVLLPLLAIMPGPNAVVILRFFIGAFAGVVAAAMTLVACTTPERHRGMAMGAVSSAIFSGSLAGVVAGGFCASYCGYTASFVLGGVLMGLAAAIAYFLVTEGVALPARHPELRVLPRLALPQFGMVWYLMILTMFMGCVQQMDAPFLPLLVEMVVNSSSDLALRWNGILGGATAACGIFGGFIIGWCSDRYPGDKVGMIISLGAALTLLPQAFCHDLKWLFAERMVMVFFVSGLSPIMQTWLSLSTNEANRGAYFGYSTSFRAIGWLVGGAVGMGITYFLGTRSIFIAGSIALVGMAWAIAWVQGKVPFTASAKTDQQT